MSLANTSRHHFNGRPQASTGAGHNPQTKVSMLHYALVFFVVAMIAALFGFGGIAAGAVQIAQILFAIFLILAIASFLFGIRRNR